MVTKIEKAETKPIAPAAKQEPPKPLQSYLPKKDTTPTREPVKPFVREKRQRAKKEDPLPTIESIEPKEEEPVKVATPK